MNDMRQLARYIDHTLLKPEASATDMDKLCEEAVEHDFYSVCVNGGWVAYCAKRIAGTSVRISAVCGFPLGANSSAVKSFEAAKAVESGAAEIDMVLPIGLLLQGNEAAVRNDIEQVVAAVSGGAIVKVILETVYLTDEQKRTACRLTEEAGAHFVKTSTGFANGGATTDDVRLMRSEVSQHIGVKASGGIRDRQTAIRMIEAGATRLGTSSGVQIVSGLSGMSGY